MAQTVLSAQQQKKVPSELSCFSSRCLLTICRYIISLNLPLKCCYASGDQSKRKQQLHQTTCGSIYMKTCLLESQQSTLSALNVLACQATTAAFDTRIEISPQCHQTPPHKNKQDLFIDKTWATYSDQPYYSWPKHIPTLSVKSLDRGSSSTYSHLAWLRFPKHAASSKFCLSKENRCWLEYQLMVFAVHIQ